MKQIRKLLVTALGLGYLPVAPGTCGSLGAGGVFLVIVFLAGPQRLVCTWIITSILAVVALAVGISLGRWAGRFYRHADPPEFVLDEVAGMWVALIAVPFDSMHQMFAVVVVQFLLFRAADIVKPGPARRCEHLPAGWGVMADDIVAAIYANVVGQIIFRAAVPGLSFWQALANGA